MGPGGMWVMEGGSVVLTIDREAWVTVDLETAEGRVLGPVIEKDLDAVRELMRELGYRRLGRCHDDGEHLEIELLP